MSTAMMVYRRAIAKCGETPPGIVGVGGWGIIARITYVYPSSAKILENGVFNYDR